MFQLAVPTAKLIRQDRFQGHCSSPLYSLLLFPCPYRDRLPVSLMPSFKLKHTFPIWLQLLRTVFRWNRLCSKHVQNMHCIPLQRCCLKISRFCYTNEAQHGLPMSATCLYESQQLFRCLAQSKIYGINVTPIQHLHFILESSSVVSQHLNQIRTNKGFYILE